ncbi:MAG: hypothetical protein N3F07_00030 [Candidatus Micrarchaeota archaeon]|nr:hypothetical protein [Candidatus Micrarchaeota archaeon]
MDLLMLFLVFASSLSITFFSLPFLIRKLAASGIVGKDVNKEGKPEVPEMGGLAVIMGVIGSLLFAIGLRTFFGYQFALVEMLAAMLTITIIALIGTFDDLFDMRKDVKTVLPMVASLPLVAVSAAGSTAISLPIIGLVDFGFLYIFLLIPLGVTVASNLTNMLAGFNGMEAGMGSVMFASALLVAISAGSVEMALLCASMLGALLAFLRYSWYPAKVFMGDIGTLAIGATLASAVIIGNMESVGAILVLPYLLDFAIKAYNRFPSTKWWGELREGKLYPVEGKVRGLAQAVMKISGGISEQKLVAFFIAAEAFFGLLAIVLYARLL